jgi:hypothetical protein
MKYILIAIAGLVGLATAPASDKDSSEMQQQIAQLQKMAAGIQLDAELVNKVNNFLQAATRDEDVKRELKTAGGEKGNVRDNPEAFPAATKALEEVELTPDDFVKAFSAITASYTLSNAGEEGDGETAKANIAFCKANEDRFVAILGAWESIRKH